MRMIIEIHITEYIGIYYAYHLPTYLLHFIVAAANGLVDVPFCSPPVDRFAGLVPPTVKSC